MEDKLKNYKPLEELLNTVRDIEGFPIGEDKDILALSDAPYYTACPNPYINDFIDTYGTPYDEETDIYERKPHVGDVVEGKNDPIYNALSYHTKVPHKAIMEFIKHYTVEGNIVLDGFGGSGMTGLSAILLGRNAIVSDISPYATYIQKNYLKPPQILLDDSELEEVMINLENQFGWVYETDHKTVNNDLFKEKGKINYTVWSEVLSCPYCGSEYNFYEVAVNPVTEEILEEYKCKECKSIITKNNSNKVLQTEYDSALNSYINRIKLVPVEINYIYKGKRFTKKPDEIDLEKILKIESMEIPYWYPSDKMMDKGANWGDSWRKGIHTGISSSHHFFTKKNLYVLSGIFENLSIENKIMQLILLTNCSKMSRYGKRTGNVSGTLYIPSLIKELNVLEYLKRKLKGAKGIQKPLKSILEIENKGKSIISVNSVTNLKNINSNTIDYIFTDPPFGENLMYSELNYICESWLKVKTNIKKEAIMNKSQEKSLYDYKILMIEAFKEYYRTLKPNRWITVEFHNSKAAVWNVIQESISRAGFIIAQVAVLDKIQGSFKQVTAAGAVSKDLVINAYKPRKDFEERFLKNAGESMEIEFVKQQFQHLPIEPNIERTEQMLYSKMLAHYIENGFKIKYNSNNFFELLENNFVELDGYWFDESEVLRYNEWKSKQGNLDKIKNLAGAGMLLFINDERTALQWIYQFLNEPKSYSDILTAYNMIVDSKSKDEIPELREMLDKNFFTEDGKYRKPYTREERTQLKKNREKELERAWEKILERALSEKKKMKTVRKEALEFGFKRCYDEENYKDILNVAKKLDDLFLEENSEITNFVDIAELNSEN